MKIASLLFPGQQLKKTGCLIGGTNMHIWQTEDP